MSFATEQTPEHTTERTIEQPGEPSTRRKSTRYRGRQGAKSKAMKGDKGKEAVDKDKHAAQTPSKTTTMMTPTTMTPTTKTTMTASAPMTPVNKATLPPGANLPRKSEFQSMINPTMPTPTETSGTPTGTSTRWSSPNEGNKKNLKYIKQQAKHLGLDRSEFFPKELDDLIAQRGLHFLQMLKEKEKRNANKQAVEEAQKNVVMPALLAMPKTMLAPIQTYRGAAKALPKGASIWNDDTVAIQERMVWWPEIVKERRTGAWDEGLPQPRLDWVDPAIWAIMEREGEVPYGMVEKDGSMRYEGQGTVKVVEQEKVVKMSSGEVFDEEELREVGVWAELLEEL